MKATETLNTAADLIGGDRERDYGAVESNHDNIGRLWTAYWGNELARQGFRLVDEDGEEDVLEFDASDVLRMMSLLKIGRMQQGAHKDDNYTDAAGYIALAGEVADPRV